MRVRSSIAIMASMVLLAATVSGCFGGKKSDDDAVDGVSVEEDSLSPVDGGPNPEVSESETTEGSETVESCGDGTCAEDEDCTSCPADCGPCEAAVCGDGTCDDGEDCTQCAQDCGACPPSCGDGECNGDETASSCPADCPAACGDGACTGDESSSTCPEDCGSACGDGTCNGDESSLSCPDDCGSVCGDGACADDESSASCAEDCGSNCGDGACNGDESSANCFEDCGSNCGDGTCNGTEGTADCAADCGSACGDGACNGDETTVNCTGDCGTLCGDGACNGDESNASCSDDCHPNCGNGTCEGPETTVLCPADCGSECGDGLCNGDESSVNCAGDCGSVCGDEACNGAETSADCAADCGSVCGDSGCNGDETSVNCHEDCGSVCGDEACNGEESSAGCPGDCGSECGDNACNGDEGTTNCPQDCGSACPDGVCNGDESTANCTADCGTDCGDDVCNGDETSANCAQDCGSVCGDDACNGDETPANCNTDCESVCPDGACTGDESCESCPADCGECPGLWGSNVTEIALDSAGAASVSGDLSEGATLGDLSWAFEPEVNCFDQYKSDWFEGNHVFYALEAPVSAGQRVTITVTPDSDVDVSLYAFRKALGDYDTPPVETVDACFRSSPESNFDDANTGEAEEVSWNKAIGEDYLVFFAVAGGEDNGTSGGYTIEVTVVDEAGACIEATNGSPKKWPDTVRFVSLDENSEAVLTGNLEQGAPVCEYDWVNANTCSPTTDLVFYQGNHVFYALENPLPDEGAVLVTVTPDPGVEVSVYGWWMGTTNFYVPPYAPGTGCDSSHAHNLDDAPNAGEAESLIFTSLGNPYNIFFSVVGHGADAASNNGTTGGYTITVSQYLVEQDDCGEELANPPTTGWPGGTTKVTLKDQFNGSCGEGETCSATVSGDLSSGEELCGMDWAEAVFCFPSTQNEHFKGNHNFYGLKNPMPPNSELYVTLTPQPGVEANLYGWQQGESSYSVPPHMTGIVACEESHGANIAHEPNPGVVETIYFQNPTDNEYNIFVGVAGDEYTGTSGGYDLSFLLNVSPGPHCPESLPGASYPTWPSNVDAIEVDDNGYGVTTGNLNDGACVNLGFATSAFCFPATQDWNFQGNHVYHRLAEPMPAKSTMTVTLTPDAGADVNLYGFQAGSTSYPVPPIATGVVSCEASHPYGIYVNASNPGEAETITFDNPTDNEYNIFIGAAGNADTGTSGGYTIEVDLDVHVPWCEESLPGGSYSSWPSEVTQIALDSDNTATTIGNLETGDCTNLEFAAFSSVACFPLTDDTLFKGNHTYFALQEPMPANSQVTFVVTPEPGVDVNIYGYQTSTDSFLVPPNVGGVVSCESSYPWSIEKTGNPGEAEWITFTNPTDNEYNIFLGVAGHEDDGTSGKFTIETLLEIGPGPWCEESLPGQSYTDWPSQVTTLSVDSDGHGETSGNLSSGDCTNLEFAQGAYCWPATQDDRFKGNHVYYAMEQPMPATSEVVVKVKPAAGVDVNLYGFQLGTTSYPVPPFVTGAVACEASYPLNITGAGNPGDEEWIMFSNPTDNEYNIAWAVAGPEGVNSGAYEVTVDVIDFVPWCTESLPGGPNTSWPSNVNVLNASNGSANANGNLSNGDCANLEFASYSSVACFPATLNKFYKGNHVYYALSEPVEPGKIVTITATPNPGVEVSLYGYLAGEDAFFVPPYVPGVLSCESSQAPGISGDPNPGQAETIQLSTMAGDGAYQVVFAVAGDDATGTSGAYQISVSID